MTMQDKIRDVFLDRCLYYYDFDLVTGIVDKDIVDKYGNNYTAQLGLVSPCTFDELMERSYDDDYFSVWHIADGGVNTLSQTSLLRAYNEGREMVEACIYLPKRDKYYRIEYYLVKDDLSGNPHVFVNCLDTTDEEKSRKQIFGELHTEKNDIEDIVDSAQIGIWHIYQFEGEKPRMTGNLKMKELLGVTENNVSDEELYDFWFLHVKKSSIPSVEACVADIMSNGFAENEYYYNHPDRGEIIVRCGGTVINVAGKGYILRGYHYDVTQIVKADEIQKHQLRDALSELQEQKILLDEKHAELEEIYEKQYAQLQEISALNELLKSQQESKEEIYSVLESMAEIFYSMHLIDLINDVATAYSSKNMVKMISDVNERASKMMYQIMSQSTTIDYRNSALEFTDLSTLRDRMRNKKIISRQFIGVVTGWFLVTFITVESDMDGKPTKVVCTTRVIDEEKRQQERLIQKTQTDELTGLYNRRAYDEDIYEHDNIPGRKEFVYISLDVNGLKLINDTVGHEAGDELLIGACECMTKVLAPHGKLYRIGGDEFVAIVLVDKEKLLRIFEEFEEALATWSGKYVKSISISYGYASKKEFPDASVRQLASIAEKRMYDAKTEHYHKKGIDRRGQQDAHKALCNLYTKILSINLTDDTYRIINMNFSEGTKEKGFAEKISEWLYSFGKSGLVHPEDLEEYLRTTDLEYMRNYFRSNNTLLRIIYRRKSKDGFDNTMMEIIPASDYSDDYQSMFLYVRSIG